MARVVQDVAPKHIGVLVNNAGRQTVCQWPLVHFFIRRPMFDVVV